MNTSAKEEKTTEEIEKGWGHLAFIVFIVIAAWAGTFLVIINVIPDWAARGQFGDLFGSVNALFSGLAFAALIYTIFLQRKELALQRIELKLQREEMKKSREELAGQAKILNSQFLATVATLKADAAIIRVEASKVDCEKRTPTTRGPFVDQIRLEAETIDLLAAELEKLNSEY